VVEWRNRLRQRGLIGVYPDGIGFGNISARAGDNTFIISATATGHLETVGPESFTCVTEYDLADNWLRCEGPERASSESLSHAAVYEYDATIQAVVHVHNLDLWNRMRGRWPRTADATEAGTPAMAFAIQSLLKAGVPEGLFVMGGHREGIVAFGASVGDASQRLLHHIT
jgi:hypothetical protein